MLETAVFLTKYTIEIVNTQICVCGILLLTASLIETARRGKDPFKYILIFFG